MRMEVIMRYIMVFLVAGLVLTSCGKKKDSNGPTGPTETPQENVFGVVTDQDGNPLANAQLHAVYQVNGAPVSPLDDIQAPFNVIFYTTQMLTTERDGNIPLAEGTNIEIMWDADDDHEYSEGDRLPPLCPTPPDNCPFQSVNFNQFSMNGVELGIGPGTFGTDPTFTSFGEHLDPSRFYLVIRCADGEPLWTSEMVDVPDGLSEFDLQFEFSECVGTPIGQSSMGFAYPNPAIDVFHLPFTLRAGETVSIVSTSLSTGGTRTLFQDGLSSGNQDVTIDISNLANGLYIYAMTAGSFTAHDTLLKNAPVENLPGEPALVTTDSDGSYAMNLPFGQTITLRESSSNPLGESAPLDSVRVVAILNGYQTADTMISLAATEQHELNFRLRPQ